MSTHFHTSTPVPVRIVDTSKDLNAYGLGNVDWKERVEGWKLKQEKNITQMNNRYDSEGKAGGEIERVRSNGEELQMADDARQRMSRVVLIYSAHFTPYRVVIILEGLSVSWLGAQRVERAKNDCMSGRELFLSDTSVFVDDAEAYEKYTREEEPDDTAQKAQENSSTSGPSTSTSAVAGSEDDNSEIDDDDDYDLDMDELDELEASLSKG